MNIKELSIPGCYQIIPKIFSDERGVFIKTFHSETFQEHGLDLELKEEFYSISKKNVLRGLHFQSPPYAHNKLVYCPKGAVLDFLLDVRAGSPTYGEHLSIELNEQNGIILYLPIGIAHGFLSLEDDSLMVYKTDCSYDPEADGGVSFSSSGIKLPIDSSNTIISERDKNLIAFDKYQSEFIYG
ncbi:dTDP-4-dehydrorhamnose 3,5-epimerase family protein [Vibrio cholerae]|uniref:dTDP-4-dehydrorhamnose 3,5-epimerase family protein n=1 Tax=Vibrio cholerae TaxID=666 RepID=UPI001157EA7C|nr:dTDP-4-dehydrorhamnose 3,5-epimerase family protein [Vibrio cholerae]TQP48985.1 dTDP-4-keto-6-deoxy-D-glucose epimerase [Vibrio cholerae]TQP83512.1 dTDP-4-keto-6-deoxy-D-glucose epimerase [Vibrio cholerae]